MTTIYMKTIKLGLLGSALWIAPVLADAVYTGQGMATDPFGAQVPYSIVVTLPTPAPTYFFDSVAGNDANDCRSVAKSCKTIAKANSLPYGAGFQALFKGSFTGNLTLTPTQVPTLGDPAHPIVIGSIDPANRATITAGNPTDGGGVILIAGVSGVTVDGLIIRGGDRAHMPRGGVMIQNNTSSAMTGITVRNSDIGNIAWYDATRPNPADPTSQGDWGAHIFVQGWPAVAGGSISNLLFENNDLHGINGPTSHDDLGIGGFGGQPINNVTVLYNRVWDIGGGPIDTTWGYPPLGDGIQANGWNNILIEHNMVHDLGANMQACGGPVGILTANVVGGLIQFNEVFRVQPLPFYKGGCDFLGIDLDNATSNVIVQYNYTHDNFNSGLYLFDGAGGNWDNNTLRFNISQNDSTGGFFGFGGIGISTPSARTVWVYNNVVYNDLVYHGQWYQNAGQGAVGISVSNSGAFGGLIANNLIMVGPSIYGGCSPWIARQNQAGWAPTAIIRNNHFQCTNGGTYFDMWWGQVEYYDIASMAAASGKFQNTTTGNPMIVAGGTGPAGYKLTTGSPLLNAGIDLTAAPYNLNIGTRDFYGNPPSRNVGADSGTH